MQILNLKPKKSDLKNFGLIMGVAFPLVFGLILPAIWSFPIPIWPYAIGLIFITISLNIPLLLKPVYYAWCAIGMVLGRVNYYVIMTGIFIFIFTPVGVYFRLVGKDPMDRAWDNKAVSYKKECKKRHGSHMEKPY